MKGRKVLSIGLLVGLFLGLAMIPVLSTPVYAATPAIYVNDMRLKDIGGVPPTIRNDRVFVPIRTVSEALGAEVGWNNALQEVSINLPNGDTELKLRINEKKASINGRNVEIDAPPFIWYSRTMVPLRFIAEGFDAEVSWNGDYYAVLISKPGFTLKPEYVSSYVPIPTETVVNPEIKRLKELLPQTQVREARSDYEPFFFVQYFTKGESNYLIWLHLYNFEAPENKKMLSAFFPNNADKAYNLLWNFKEGFLNGELNERQMFSLDGKKCGAELFDNYVVLYYNI